VTIKQKVFQSHDIRRKTAPLIYSVRDHDVQCQTGRFWKDL